MKSYRGEIEHRIPELRQYARALVPEHRPEVADDLVRDALTHALRLERGWMGEDVSIRLFSRLIATNRLRLRSELGERRPAAAPSFQGGAAQAARPSGRDSSGSRSGHGVSQVLETLALGDREALLLVTLCRIDYPQAAQILGISVATLVTRLSHVRDQIGGAFWAEPDRGTGLGRRSAPSYLRLVKS